MSDYTSAPDHHLDQDIEITKQRIEQYKARLAYLEQIKAQREANRKQGAAK